MNSRQVILYIAQSLDGYIARLNRSIDWLPQELDEKFSKLYAEFYNSIDTIIMGYKTYLQITTELSEGNWPYLGTKSFILTRTPKKGISDEFTTFTDRDVVELIHDLKNQQGKNIWIVGGTSCIHPLIQKNMIDEYVITTIPKLIGNGIRLFPNHDNDIPLTVTKTIMHKNIVQTIYTKS
ncbi:MAG: dihydrofolate reductase family protein [Brevinemataceae bacterium]